MPLACTFDGTLLSCDWRVTEPMTGQVTRQRSGQQKLGPCSLYVVKEVRTAERLTCQSSSPRALKAQGSFPSIHPTREKYPSGSLTDTAMKKWWESFAWTLTLSCVCYLLVHKHRGQYDKMCFLRNIKYYFPPKDLILHDNIHYMSVCPHLTSLSLKTHSFKKYVVTFLAYICNTSAFAGLLKHLYLDV